MVQAAGDVPPEAMARMTAAEARLYPLAMVDPGRYERATTLVGLVAAELRRSCRRVDEVLARREELLAALPRLADDSGVGMADLVPADVVDAASALVCRQLQAHARRSHVARPHRRGPSGRPGVARRGGRTRWR